MMKRFKERDREYIKTQKIKPELTTTNKNKQTKTPSQKVLSILSKSQLDGDILETICKLADHGNTGYYDRKQFIIAMHLATVSKGGSPLPTGL